MKALSLLPQDYKALIWAVKSDLPSISSKITNVADSDIRDLDLDLAFSPHPLPPSSQQATLSKWSCIF